MAMWQSSLAAASPPSARRAATRGGEPQLQSLSVAPGLFRSSLSPPRGKRLVLNETFSHLRGKLQANSWRKRRSKVAVANSNAAVRV